MKHIKSYNESVRQYLKPKSNEEILDKLSKLDDNEKIKRIIEYQLDYSFLPRNEDGFCIYESDLFIGNKKITKLPDNLVVKGSLVCNTLPENIEKPKGVNRIKI